MKRQYLGDSKDSFKWGYLDYLTTGLNYPLLNVVLMLTPDDNSKQGKTKPELFPSREEVIDFCRVLKKQKDFQLIKKLPKSTGSKYLVELHKEETYFTSENRQEYMTDISSQKRQVLFLDPDNGFEPEKSRNEKHVLYSDVVAILKQMSEEAVISVFQHFRYISFNKDFARIKERIPSGFITALCWHSLMFVTISKTEEIIKKVSELNHQYSQKYPVKVLQ
ncbi:MAG: hypothetical protein Q8M34_08990 [Thermodesulfovibrionales bacterium]|nr:hypothetical protein [Thermodesulfovibrionales bacterium]